MKAIWKYQLKTIDIQQIEMPIGAKILTVQTQYNVPTLWALVNPESHKENRSFAVFGTGHAIEYDDNFEYIGTFQERGGSLIWHLFELQ